MGEVDRNALVSFGIITQGGFRCCGVENGGRAGQKKKTHVVAFDFFLERAMRCGRGCGCFPSLVRKNAGGRVGFELLCCETAHFLIRAEGPAETDFAPIWWWSVHFYLAVGPALDSITIHPLKDASGAVMSVGENEQFRSTCMLDWLQPVPARDLGSSWCFLSMEVVL